MWQIHAAILELRKLTSITTISSASTWNRCSISFGGLYRVWADPRLLLVSQALATGLAGWMLYRCASEVTLPWPAAGVAAAFLLSVPLHNALAFDFHPEVMSSLLVFTGLWLALRGRPWAGAACWAALLLFKEDEALLLPGLGLLLLLISRRRLPAIVLAAAGPVWLLLAVGLIQPHWRHGYPGDLSLDYAAFGRDLPSAAQALLQHPFVAVSLITGRGGFSALLQWIASMGSSVIVAPLSLMAVAPELLLQLASRRDPQHLLRLHYGVEAVPVVFAFLVLQFGRLRPWPRLTAAVCGLAVTCALLAFVVSSPFRPAATRASASSERLKDRGALIAIVPPGAELRADSTIAAHLSHRERIQEFPGSDWGDYVALDRSGFHPQTSAGYDAAVASLPVEGYVRIFDRQGVELWKR